jgi:hypothetical protein
LTPEAIEAALSAYEPIANEETGELSEDTQAFLDLMLNNERLRLELSSVQNAIGCPEGFDPLDWQGLAKAGHVNPQLMQKVTMLCDMFFWVGWHARGAVDEADALNKMMK